METLEMNVKGMTCMHCVMAVKKAVTGVSGVKNVDVDLPTGHVKVQYEGDSSLPVKMKEAIIGQGYEVV